MVRVKWRYILTQIITGPELHPKNKIKVNEFTILECAKRSLKNLHGDHGVGVLQRSFRVKYINEDTLVVLIRTARGAHVKLLQALALVNKIGEYDAFFNTIHVSGTLRSCYKYLRSYAKQELIRLHHASTDPAEKKMIQSKLDNYKKCEEKRKGKKKVTEMAVDSEDSEFSEGSE